jgi:hypothetical protein
VPWPKPLPDTDLSLLADLERDRPDLARMLAWLLMEHDRRIGSDFLESSLNVDEQHLPSLTG